MNSVKVYIQIGDDSPDCIVDYSGVIQKYTPEFVKIADTHYTRVAHEFRTHLPKSNQ